MFKKVDAVREELLEVMKKMITFPSTPGNEEGMANYTLELVKEIPGVEAFMDECGNVVGILRGTGEGPNILLTGHMDVVDPGKEELWAPFSPFVPVVEDGKLYGRGICDMKAGLAESLYTLKLVAEYCEATGTKLAGDLVFCGVVQEEPACMFGMEYFCEHTMKDHDLKFDMVYISEPTGNNVINAQRGKVELVVKTYGKCAHSSTPEAGINAFEHMNPIVRAIFKHDGISIKETPLCKGGITITNCVVKPGGILSTIPDYCEIAIDRRYTPGETREELLGEFEAIFEKVKEEYPDLNATVEERVYPFKSFTGYEKDCPKAHYAWETPLDNEYVKITLDAMKTVSTAFGTGCATGGTDGSYSRGLLDIPTVLLSGAGFQTAHQEKENVVIEDIYLGLDNYVAIMNAMYNITID